MQHARSKIDAEEAVRLYVDEGWSVREIADHLGSSYGRVYGLLRHRVVMRTRIVAGSGEGSPRTAMPTRPPAGARRAASPPE